MRHRSYMLGSLAAAFALGSCGGDQPQPYEPAAGDDAAGVYWALELNYEVATLSTEAPHNTLQLIATPRDALGRAIEGLGTVHFNSITPEVASIDANGLVTATAPGQSIKLTAELAAGGTRHADTVYINVTTAVDPAPIAQFSIEPPDSTIWAVGGDGMFSFINRDGSGGSIGYKLYLPTALDVNGLPVFDMLPSFRSSDTTVLQVIKETAFVLFHTKSPGHASIYATTTRYGVTVGDTVDFTVTNPTFAIVRVRPDPSDPSKFVFMPSDLSVAPGATIIFTNVTGTPADIVFSDPSGVVEHGPYNCSKAGITDAGGVGDIPAFGVPQGPSDPLHEENCRSRKFVTPGELSFHSPSTGATGRIVVETGVSD